jgi:hypothetical protein
LANAHSEHGAKRQPQRPEEYAQEPPQDSERDPAYGREEPPHDAPPDSGSDVGVTVARTHDMNSRLSVGTPAHAQTLPAVSRGSSPATSGMERPVRYAQAARVGRSDGPSSSEARTSSSRETSTSPSPTLIHLVAPSTSTLDAPASSPAVASCALQPRRLLSASPSATPCESYDLYRFFGHGIARFRIRNPVT